jgi:ribosomal protein S18 acetylase RimI-like enzyme
VLSSRSRRSRTSRPAGPEVVIRQAALRDASAITHVRGRTWQVAYAHIFPKDALDDVAAAPEAEWLRDVISNPPPRTHTLVADAAGHVVGFAQLGPMRGESSDPRLGELYAIYVLPEAQRRGVGRALMVEVMDRLAADGFEEAVLWVLEDNPRTRSFYELAGWQADGGSQDEEWLGTLVREVRYRHSLEPTT